MSNYIIKFLDEDSVAQAENLWDYCFEKSSSPFFQWYFKQAKHRENIIGYLVDNRLLSMLFLNPYTINFHNQHLRLSYIVGVATIATERGRGLFSELIKKTFSILEEREEPIALLMPSMAGFYLPYGFAFCYEQLQYDFPLEVLRTFKRKQNYDLQILLDSHTDYTALNNIYNEFHQHHQGYIVRNHENWQATLEVPLLEGGQIVLCYQDNTLQGYMLYSISLDTFKVLELVYLSIKVRDAFFNFAYQHYSQAKKISWHSATDDLSYLGLIDHKNAPSKVLFMMSRIINVPKAMALLSPAKDLNLEIFCQVTDEYIESNNKTFFLQVANGTVQTTISDENPEFEIGIGSLAQLLFGYSSPQILAQNGLLKCFGQNILTKLQKLFLSKTNYINEYF